MKRLALTLALAVSLAACQTSSFTGRSQLLLFPEAYENNLGVQGYAEVSKEAPVTGDPALNAPLVRVGEAIAAVADRMLADRGRAPYEWEFKVIREDDTLNAWCMPGGKIAFYTGIYPVCADEAGMAIVMGHEVCHALLRHGGERMSQVGLSQAVLAGADIFAADSEYRGEILGALGAGVQYGVLMPYSRSHESEADKLGLMLAAEAGYDPRVAVRVWEKMAELSEGKRPPELLSTHPDPLNRVANMRAWMPEALEAYERSNKQPNPPLPKIGK